MIYKNNKNYEFFKDLIKDLYNQLLFESNKYNSNVLHEESDIILDYTFIFHDKNNYNFMNYLRKYLCNTDNLEVSTMLKNKYEFLN